MCARNAGLEGEPSAVLLHETKSFSSGENPLRLGFRNNFIYTTRIRVFPSRGLFMSGRIAWAAYDVMDFSLSPQNSRPSKVNTSKSNQCASSNVYLDGHNQLRSPGIVRPNTSLDGIFWRPLLIISCSCVHMLIVILSISGGRRPTPRTNWG